MRKQEWRFSWKILLNCCYILLLRLYLHKFRYLVLSMICLCLFEKTKHKNPTTYIASQLKRWHCEMWNKTEVCDSTVINLDCSIAKFQNLKNPASHMVQLLLILWWVQGATSYFIVAFLQVPFQLPPQQWIHCFFFWVVQVISLLFPMNDTLMQYTHTHTHNTIYSILDIN